MIHGRMDQQEMEAFFEKEQVGLVIDATHPFAVIVTENIQRACKNSGIEYLRCLRDFLTEARTVRSEKFACERTNAITKSDSSVVCVNSVEEAVDYLEQTQGNILITTGSKELDKYTRLTNYKERCYVRVLSVLPSVMQSIDLGFSGKHLIAMQGPFSREMNLALLHQTEAKYFVTKESGKNGGFAEKLEAAEQAGAERIVLCDTNGGSFPQEIAAVVEAVKKVCHVPLGIHCHNDMDCAVAASMMAVEAGCEQVQGTLSLLCN